MEACLAANRLCSKTGILELQKNAVLELGVIRGG